jgi:hypothetical protein
MKRFLIKWTPSRSLLNISLLVTLPGVCVNRWFSYEDTAKTIDCPINSLELCLNWEVWLDLEGHLWIIRSMMMFCRCWSDENLTLIKLITMLSWAAARVNNTRSKFSLDPFIREMNWNALGVAGMRCNMPWLALFIKVGGELCFSPSNWLLREFAPPLSATSQSP